MYSDTTLSVVAEQIHQLRRKEASPQRFSINTANASNVKPLVFPINKVFAPKLKDALAATAAIPPLVDDPIWSSEALVLSSISAPKPIRAS